MALSKIYWTEQLLQAQYDLLDDRVTFLRGELGKAQAEVDYWSMLLQAAKDGRTVVSVIPDQPTGKVLPTISEDS